MNAERDAYYAKLKERSEREDLVLFINACFAATGQADYYSDRNSHGISIDFLHQYVLANYRTVYARALAAGINHFNQAAIIFHLLSSGSPLDPALREEEGELIAASIQKLPANRAYALIDRLSRHRVNNRRTRATIKRFMESRRDLSFDAVKYRSKLKIGSAHVHAKLEEETGRFLFRPKDQKGFTKTLFDAYVRAQYSKSAIYELPFTVAESLSHRHGIDRKEFLRKIEPQMTLQEKQRMQSSAAELGHQLIPIDLSQMPLTKLVLYALSLSYEDRKTRSEELDQALRTAARRSLKKTPLSLGKAAAVLDRSRSSYGSRERRRRPLAVAIAVSYLLSESSSEFKSFWTSSHHGASELDGSPETDIEHIPILQKAGGQTDLMTPLLKAIEYHPDTIIIVSDGFENSPPNGVQQIVAAYKARLMEKHRIAFVHANPVFDPQHFSPRRLGSSLVTIGLRDAEDFATSLGFARFASGEGTQQELESYLAELAKDYLQS